LAALVTASEFAARRFDPATVDERAILQDFVPTLQEPDCAPLRTSAISQRPHERQWVEASPAEAARFEAVSRQAKPRDVRLLTDRGWMLPFLSWAFGGCRHRVRISTPSIVGDIAFVTAASDQGVVTSAYVRKAGRWAWAGAAWDGSAIIQY
jgi:hypothetical protein